MHGNVREWCADSFRSSYRVRRTSSWGPRFHVVRGGCWIQGSRSSRSAYRLGVRTDIEHYDIGFRVARTARESKESGKSQDEEKPKELALETPDFETSGPPAGSSRPRLREPPGRPRGPGGPGRYGPRSQRYNGRFEADKVVVIKVVNLSSAACKEALRRAREASDGTSWSGSYGGSKATLIVAPVEDVEAFAAKIDFGEVTNVDADNRKITVDAAGNQ
jgi:hypothetical protein